MLKMTFLLFVFQILQHSILCAWQLIKLTLKILNVLNIGSNKEQTQTDTQTGFPSGEYEPYIWGQ